MITSLQFEIALTIGGALLIIFSKTFAKAHIKSQNRAWGFKFGEKEEKETIFVSRLIGLIAILMALLDFFGFFGRK